MKWIDFPWLAIRVVLVPVDALCVIVQPSLNGGVTLHAVLLVDRQIGTLVHAGAVGN